MKELPFKKEDVVAINTWLTCFTLDIAEAAAYTALDNICSALCCDDFKMNYTRQDCFDWVQSKVADALYDKPVILMKPYQPRKDDERFYKKGVETFIALDEVADYLLALFGYFEGEVTGYDREYMSMDNPMFPLNAAIWSGYIFDGLDDRIKAMMKTHLDEVYTEITEAFGTESEDYIADLLEGLYVDKD